MKTLKEIAGTITYKENWSFYINDLADHFVCKVTLTCSRTGLPITQHFIFDNCTAVSAGCKSPESYVYECIRKVEFHEVGEWLRFDGQLRYDPHDPDAWIRAGLTPPLFPDRQGGWIGDGQDEVDEVEKRLRSQRGRRRKKGPVAGGRQVSEAGS